MLTTLFLAAGLTVLAAACGGSEPAAPVAAPPAVAAETPLPKPVTPPVLVIRGGTRPNVGAEVRLDQASLDALATYEQKLYEPFVKREVRFTGIYMAELLARAGVASGTVTVHALDDYTMDIAVSELVKPGVMLATKADGASIPIAAGGPIRLVFPPSSAIGRSTDAWVWSIDTMTVA